MDKIIKKSPILSNLLFAIQTIKKFDEVGAIFPSSKFLGFEMLRSFDNRKENLKILEVGPGTGPFTELIVKNLKTSDKLDVIEFNPDFVKILKSKYGHHQNVNIVCASIIDWKPEYKYDYIVSSLPFNIFPLDFVKKIVEHYESIVNDNANISYFEYMLFPKIKETFLVNQKKDEYLQVKTLLSDFNKKYNVEKSKVFKNIPPANVYNLKIVK